MRPLFCRSRKSNSSPRSPSVWPNTAPTTSGFSTIPSASRRAWMRYLVVLGSMFIFALLDPVGVPSLRRALPIAHGRAFRDAVDESVERFDVGDVLPAEHCEPRAEVLVEPHPVRGEPVPQLTSETSAPHVPVRQDDRLAVVGRNRLAQPEHGGALVDHTNVSGHAQRAQRALVVFAFHDDRRAAILFREVLEDR